MRVGGANKIAVGIILTCLNAVGTIKHVLQKLMRGDYLRAATIIQE